jgi:hypothetical protein
MASTGADIPATMEWKRWVGLGVIADNLINLGCAIAAQPAT